MQCCDGVGDSVTRVGHVLNENVTGCVCTEPGWCERHRCFKSDSLIELCQRRSDFFQSWEQGKGIGQQTQQTPPPKSRTDCVHLGEVADEILCPTCQGAVRIRVYACGRHEKCTLGKVIDEVTCCVSCVDYQPR